MGRRGKRKRIATNIYADQYGLSVTVKVGALQREKRYPTDTPLSVMKAWRDETRVELRKLAPVRRRRGAATTLREDVESYIPQIRHLVSWRERRAELRAWVKLYGDWPRHRITPEHVRAARTQWLDAHVAPKTINNRVFTLQHLYRVLDATPATPKPPTPCDLLRPLHVHRTPAVAVPPSTIRRVAKTLLQHERQGLLRTSKTRARFMVLASTGRRPSEVKRAEPTDVDLRRRVWTVRDGKGGWSPGIYLNDDMIAAWRLFIQAEAWGTFRTSSYTKRLYHAGWPKDVRPYNLRHTVGIRLSEAGVDLADIQVHMGHKRIETTRKHYVPVLHSRLQDASRLLEGQLGWGKKADGRKAG